MTLKDYILTYEVNGEIVVNLFDYYDLYIRDLDERFKRYSYKITNLVLCFFKEHDDINPSMGYIKSKTHKKVRVCHCFGCNRSADVVRLHQIISQQYHGVELTEKDACIDLANKFNVPLDDYMEFDEGDYESRHIKRLMDIEKLSEKYTVRDYGMALLGLRQNNQVSLESINMECVKMIATHKKLYG